LSVDFLIVNRKTIFTYLCEYTNQPNCYQHATFQHTKMLCCMNLSLVSHTIITDMSQSLGNAIGNHFIQDSDRLPMKLCINLFLLCLQ
jgi:hypothetical protein